MVLAIQLTLTMRYLQRTYIIIYFKNHTTLCLNRKYLFDNNEQYIIILSCRSAFEGFNQHILYYVMNSPDQVISLGSDIRFVSRYDSFS